MNDPTNKTTSEPARGFDTDELRELLETRQDGVVSRRQLRELGARPTDVRRLIRRAELVVVHPGVYVDHNGPLSWDQRAWLAVLVHWPAALTRQSALPDPDPDGAIHVAVAVHRTVTRVPGVVAHRTADLDGRVRWNRSPPRMKLEHAVIDVASGRIASGRIADVAGAFRVLATTCHTRLTTPASIGAALVGRDRVAGRALIEELLADLGSGACSVLEREWLRIEQTHGLPVAERQNQSRSGHKLAYRDADYEDFRLLVELDGKAHHDNALARDKDADRDLDAAVGGDALTVRLTYGQVFRDGCHTARRVGLLLNRRGWAGVTLRCPSCPNRTDCPPT